MEENKEFLREENEENFVNSGEDLSCEKEGVNAGTLPTEKAAPVDRERKKKRLRTILLYLLFFLLNVAVILVFVLREDKTGDRALFSEVQLRLGQNAGFTFLSIASYLMIILLDVVVFNVIIRQLGYQNKGLLATKTAIYGRYYDKITPWSIGGEPFQIGYLTFGGLRAGEACAVTMSRHIVRFFATAPVVVAILIISRISANIFVMLAAILSVSFGLIVPSVMLLCALKPIVGEKIGVFLIRVLSKIKIVKDPEKVVKKLRENIEKFSLGVKFLGKNKRVVPLIVLSAMAELALTNAVPYFVIRSFGYSDIAFWHTFVLCIYVTYASSFAPTPGGVGLAELSFYAIFATVVPDGYLFWAVLFWRVSVFYLPVAIGFLLHAVDSARGIIASVKK